MLAMFLCHIKWGVVISLYLTGGNVYLFMKFKDRGVELSPDWSEDMWMKLLVTDQIYAAFFAIFLVTYFMYTIKQSEEELEQSKNTILEQQETLFKNSRMTELGELSGGIAHEINNPLAIILGANQRIQRELRSDHIDSVMVAEMCDKIERTGKRISRIIIGLQSYSRDGQRDPMQEIMLEKIFEDITEIFREKFSFNQVTFNIICEDDRTPFLGRYVQVYQILVNLLTNAFDAIEGSDHKSITIEVSRDENGFLCISVVDSGSGIPLEIEEKVFNPFFTTKPVGRGTGLGLSIVAGIMAEHGGEILVDRSRNDSRVTVKFPLAQQQNIAS